MIDRVRELFFGKKFKATLLNILLVADIDGIVIVLVHSHSEEPVNRSKVFGTESCSKFLFEPLEVMSVVCKNDVVDIHTNDEVAFSDFTNIQAWIGFVLDESHFRVNKPIS